MDNIRRAFEIFSEQYWLESDPFHWFFRRLQERFLLPTLQAESLYVPFAKEGRRPGPRSS